MPLVSVRSGVSIERSNGKELMEGLSAAVADELGKPEQYVMVELQGARMLMSGEPGPAAAVDVRSIGGLDRETNGRLAERISDLLQSHLGVERRRVYVVFTSVSGESWAWNGRTFR